MRYILLVLILTACGADDHATNDRTDTNRQCYDECTRNADCADGLVCSERAWHVCVPIDCLECWMTETRQCVITEEYADDMEYPVCVFDHCEG